MKSWLLVGLISFAIGCSDDGSTDPVVACNPSCGPADLALISAHAIVPAGRALVYSGDTVQLNLVIRNLSGVTSDSAFISADPLPTGPSIFLPIGRIPADTIVTYTVTAVLPLVNSSFDTATARRWRVSAFSDTDYAYDNNIRETNSVGLLPTLIRMTGPDTIFVDEPSTFQVTVTNPSPRILASAVVSICYVYFNCSGPALARVTAPDVPAGGSASFPVTVSVPFNAERMPLPARGAMVACYGRPQFGECGSARTVLRARP